MAQHPDRLWEWCQETLAKGQGARVIALIQAVDDWMQVCHQQEAEIERLETALDEAQLRSIEASNPGIDMDEVRRIRAGDSGRTEATS